MGFQCQCQTAMDSGKKEAFSHTRVRAMCYVCMCMVCYMGVSGHSHAPTCRTTLLTGSGGVEVKSEREGVSGGSGTFEEPKFDHPPN